VLLETCIVVMDCKSPRRIIACVVLRLETGILVLDCESPRRIVHSLLGGSETPTLPFHSKVEASNHDQ
jgi:hypothetical protein